LALMGWRALLMLLCHEKLSWDWQSLLHTVLEEANNLTGKLRQSSDVFEAFIAETFSQNELLRIVSIINSNITISITSGMFQPEKVEKAVKILDFFNLANDRRPHKQRVAYKEFYNDAINNEVNLQSHLKAWIDYREKCRVQRKPYDRHEIFTLCNYPWILDAANKAEMIKLHNKVSHAQQQQINLANLLMMPAENALFLFLEVRREFLLEDTLNIISNGSMNLKKPLRVQFVGEPGIDEGGVRKEFFQILLKKLFDPSYGMFSYNERQRLYWFSGADIGVAPVQFELVGTLLGLAINNNILIDVPFPMVVFKTLLD